MSFYHFIMSLPFPDEFSALIFLLLAFLAGFGIYKFVKDWLPW